MKTKKVFPNLLKMIKCICERSKEAVELENFKFQLSLSSLSSFDLFLVWKLVQTGLVNQAELSRSRKL